MPEPPAKKPRGIQRAQPKLDEAEIDCDYVDFFQAAFKTFCDGDDREYSYAVCLLNACIHEADAIMRGDSPTEDETFFRAFGDAVLLRYVLYTLQSSWEEAEPEVWQVCSEIYSRLPKRDELREKFLDALKMAIGENTADSHDSCKVEPLEEFLRSISLAKVEDRGQVEFLCYCIKILYRLSEVYCDEGDLQAKVLSCADRVLMSEGFPIDSSEYSLGLAVSVLRDVAESILAQEEGDFQHASRVIYRAIDLLERASSTCNSDSSKKLAFELDTAELLLLKGACLALLEIEGEEDCYREAKTLIQRLVDSEAFVPEHLLQFLGEDASA